MKFYYEYRTRDNVRHEGIIFAADRDAVFAELKAKGINPARVVEAPGFFNKLFGKGKRWLVICVLGGCLVVLLLLLRSALHTAETAGADLQAAREQTKDLVSIFDSPTRRQVIGDVAIISKGIASGWEEVFPYEGERFLASFAIPGVPAGLRNTTEAEIRAALNRSADESVGGEEDSAERLGLEARQIRAIVEGMKQELREFIAGNKHTIIEYGQRLVQRQEMEISYYNRAKAELERLVENKAPRADIITLWETNNDRLRRMGIKLLPLPE